MKSRTVVVMSVLTGSVERSQFRRSAAPLRINARKKGLGFRTAGALVLAVFLGIVSSVGGRAHSMKDPRGSAVIRVRLYNYSFATAADLVEIETAASKIFVASSMYPRWIQCYPIRATNSSPAPCAQAADDTTVFLLIVNSPDHSADVLGSTACGSSRVKICYKVGVAMQRNFPGLSSGQILGHVAAHEIGHVFLGAHAHSAVGIMRPTFRTCDLSEMAHGHLLFLPEQSRLLRARILSLSSALP
jgi:hypothetical protein